MLGGNEDEKAYGRPHSQAVWPHSTKHTDAQSRVTGELKEGGQPTELEGSGRGAAGRDLEAARSEINTLRVKAPVQTDGRSQDALGNIGGRVWVEHGAGGGGG